MRKEKTIIQILEKLNIYDDSDIAIDIKEAEINRHGYLIGRESYSSWRFYEYVGKGRGWISYYDELMNNRLHIHWDNERGEWKIQTYEGNSLNSAKIIQYKDHMGNWWNKKLMPDTPCPFQLKYIYTNRFY